MKGDWVFVIISYLVVVAISLVSTGETMDELLNVKNFVLLIVMFVMWCCAFLTSKVSHFESVR